MAISELTDRPTGSPWYRYLPEDDWRFASLIIAGFTVIHLFAATQVQPFHDEAYYFLWSFHPSLGYFDHPPMVAWWVWLGNWLFGDTDLAARSVVLASFLVDSVAIYGIGSLLFDRRIGLRAAVWFNATILLAAAGFIVTPDAPAMMFWTLATLAFVLVVKTEKGIWWLAVGLAAGLGLISKHTDFFLGLGLVLCLLVIKDLRRWLVSPWTWAGGFIALAVFAPVFFWDMRHGGGALAFQFGRIAEDDPAFPEFLIAHTTEFAILLNPLVAIFAGLGVWRWTRGQSRNQYEIGILILLVAPMIVFLTGWSFISLVHQNWLLPIYPTFAVVAAYGGSMVPDLLRRPWWLVRRSVVTVGLVTAVLAALFLGGPLGPALPGVAPIFKGADEFAAKIERLRLENGALWVGVNDYRYASELGYLLRNSDVVIEDLIERYRYVYRPLPDAEVIGQRGLILIMERENGGDIPACLPGLTPVGNVDYLVDGLTTRTFSAFIVENAPMTAFEVGCDALS